MSGIGNTLSLDGIIEQLVNHGQLDPGVDLSCPSNHAEIRKIQRAWLSHRQVGCAFAMQLAGRKSPESWVDIIAYDDMEPFSVMREVLAHVNGQAPAIQVIFPDSVGDIEKFAGYIAAISGDSHWDTEIYQDDASPKHFALGLRFRLPSTKFVSWVLGLGDFEGFPLTRRAPFPSLIFRTGPPGAAPTIADARKARPPSDVNGFEPVHLADYPVDQDPDRLKKTWKATQTLKSRALSDCPYAHFAKAKYTAVFPGALITKFRQ